MIVVISYIQIRHCKHAETAQTKEGYELGCFFGCFLTRIVTSQLFERYPEHWDNEGSARPRRTLAKVGGYALQISLDPGHWAARIVGTETHVML